MDNKVIFLLEQMNSKLEKIYNTLKAMDHEKNNKNHTIKKNENKVKEQFKKEDTEDVLRNWESKMPLNEVMDKLYPNSKYKGK